MNIQKISDNIEALLKDLKDDSDETVFATVLPAPPDSEESFTGYPSAALYYSTTDPSYATVSQNRRVIEFVVELYVVASKDVKQIDVLRGEVYPLVDQVIQMFDESIDLSSSALSLTRACDIMRPAPANMTRIETNEGLGWQVDIRLYCEADTAFRNS